MVEKNTSVYGLYQNTALAERALDQLTSAQFASDDVSVLMRGGPEGQGSGGTLGLLAGFAPLSIPEAGPLISGGPIRNALADQGAVEGGGGLEAAFAELGFSGHDAQVYATRISEGYPLLGIRCYNADEVGRASGVLKSIGAETVVLLREATTGAARISS
jgi:hypothetical protein